MKSKLTKLKGTARQLSVEIPKETVDQTFDEVLEGIRKEAKIPGFRPGKAPIDIVKKNYAKDAEDELHKRLIPQAYENALAEHQINPLSYPELSDINLSDAGVFTFTARVDVYPEVKVKNYKKLKVSTTKIDVSDKEADEVLTRIRNMHADFNPTDRPLEKGDFGICDVDTTMDGKAISKKRENMWIEVDKEASMMGIGEELLGLKKGDKKDIEATLPENYPDKNYAGKKAEFHVEVKETREKKVPDLGDEFAKKIGKENMDEAKSEVKTQLIEQKESDAKGEMKNQILEQLLRNDSTELPESMVKRQLKVLTERAEADLAKKGVDAESIESHKKELQDQLTKEAENKVKIYFILGEVADRENLAVSDEEVDSWIKSLAANYNKTFEEVKKYYQEHDLVGGLVEQLREEKALDFLLEEAEVAVKK